MTDLVSRKRLYVRFSLEIFEQFLPSYRSNKRMGKIYIRELHICALHLKRLEMEHRAIHHEVRNEYEIVLKKLEHEDTDYKIILK